MGTPVKALVITTEGEMRTHYLNDTYHGITEVVGGYIDCVRHDLFVGYVHDEGLLIPLPLNYMASALFGRPLAGDCVVVGSMNEQGEYDGESYDAPEPLFSDEFRELLTGVASDPMFREAVGVVLEQVLNTPPTVLALSDDQFTAWLNGDDVYGDVE